MEWLKNLQSVVKKWKKKEEKKEEKKGQGSIERITFAISFWLVLFFILSAISLFTTYSITIGVVAWFVALAYWHRLFLVSVPEVTGLVTINLLTGELHPYGTGIHFRFPWEQVKEGNFINLRIVTQERSEDYPSEDGPVLKVKWSFQYKSTVEGLPKYIAVDETTVNKGFGDVGSSFLGARIASEKAEACVNTREAIEKELQKKFEDVVKLGDTAKDHNLEQLYGVDLLRVSLADIDFETKYQGARSTQATAKKLKEVASNIQKGKKINDKDAFNAALIINGDVKKSIQEVEGEGGNALASLFMAMANAAGGRK
jgi:hypothetical protein